MATTVSRAPLDGWPQADAVDTARESLRQAAEDFAETTRYFAENMVIVGHQYMGPGDIDLQDAPLGVNAFGEGTRTFAQLVDEALGEFAEDLRELVTPRELALSKISAYNTSPPANRYYRVYDQTVREDGSYDRPGDTYFDVMANEPPDLAGEQARRGPSVRVELTSFIVAPDGVENNVKCHLVTQGLTGGLPTEQDIKDARDYVVDQFDQAVRALTDRLNSIAPDSSAFDKAFSSNDDFYDSGSGILGPIADAADPPSDKVPVPGIVRGISKTIGGILALFDVVSSIHDERQDAQQRVQFEHPEWSAEEKAAEAAREGNARAADRATVNLLIGLLGGAAGPGGWAALVILGLLGIDPGEFIAETEWEAQNP